MEPFSPVIPEAAYREAKARVWTDEMALVVVTIVWGSTFVVVSGLVARVPPSQVLVTRFALAAALLLALSWRRWPAGDPVLRRGGVVLGLWLAAGFGLQTVGLAYTTPARSGFITGFCVLLPPIFTALAHRRLPAGRVLLAVALAGCGVGLISWPGPGQGVNTGDLLTGVCALAYGAHIYYTGRYAARTRPDALTALQVLVATLVFAAASGLAAAAVRLAPAGSPPAWAAALVGRPWQWTPAIILGILYLTLFATVLAYFLQTRSQQRISSSRAGILLALEPLFAALLSVLLGLDALTARLLVGGGLVVGGIVVSGDG